MLRDCHHDHDFNGAGGELWPRSIDGDRLAGLQVGYADCMLTRPLADQAFERAAQFIQTPVGWWIGRGLCAWLRGRRDRGCRRCGWRCRSLRYTRRRGDRQRCVAADQARIGGQRRQRIAER